jgi:hypothetical protein
MSQGQAFDYSAVEFINEQEREYFAEAHLGEQVRDFLVSPVGRYLHGRAKQTISECKDKLADLDPTVKGGIAQWKAIKQDMANAEAFMKWCAEAIVNGDNAARQLEEYRE